MAGTGIVIPVVHVVHEWSAQELNAIFTPRHPLGYINGVTFFSLSWRYLKHPADFVVIPGVIVEVTDFYRRMQAAGFP